MSDTKFSPLLSLARHAQRRRMEMQCDPQWVLDVFAERDALGAEVERLQARLSRIEYVAGCGSVQSWLALPDDAKAQWFAMHLEMDDERRARRKDAARIEWLAGQARMIYGRKGEASYQLEELPEPIQSGREECRPDDLRRAIDEAMERAE